MQVRHALAQVPITHRPPMLLDLEHFKVFRTKEGDEGAVEEKQTLAEVTQDLGQRVKWKGRSVRALNPLSAEDASLFEAVSRGGFMIDGFSNRQIRAILFPNAEAMDTAAQKRLSAKVTRWLRLLRGHGLIAKVPKTHRYQVTEKGQTTLSVILAARQANAKLLLQAA